jgi:hypothetical protein
VVSGRAIPDFVRFVKPPILCADLSLVFDKYIFDARFTHGPTHLVGHANRVTFQEREKILAVGKIPVVKISSFTLVDRTLCFFKLVQCL